MRSKANPLALVGGLAALSATSLTVDNDYQSQLPLHRLMFQKRRVLSFLSNRGLIHPFPILSCNSISIAAFGGTCRMLSVYFDDVFNTRGILNNMPLSNGESSIIGEGMIDLGMVSWWGR